MARYRKRILILDAGDAPYSLVAARSLSSAGYVVDLGFPYGNRIFDAYSRYCNEYLFYPDPVSAKSDFKKFVKRLVGKYDVFLPTMEKTQLALSEEKSYYEENGAVLPIPNYNLLRMMLNKVNVLDFCKKNGITIPKSIILTRAPDFSEIVRELGIPFIMKVSTEIDIPPGERYFVIRQKTSQIEFEQKFAYLAQYGPVIFQEYVCGIGVGASFIFSKNTDLLALFGHKRILERFSEGGPSVIAKTCLLKDVIMQGYKLLHELKWQGAAMTEFKLCSDGKLYFMEVNPRFWGTLPLANASGVDFPKILVENYESEKKIVSKTINNRTLVRAITLPNIFVSSLSSGDFFFTRNIAKSSLQMLDNGFPFFVEFEKLDLKPLLKETANRFYSRILKGKMTCIKDVENIFFGPALPQTELLAKGIDVEIDLRESHEKSSNVINDKVTYYSFPIKDDSAPSTDFLFSIISVVNEIINKKPVYIHCRMGRGRASMVVLCFLLSRNMPLEKAYSIVYNARPFAYLNSIQKTAVYNFYKFCNKLQS